MSHDDQIGTSQAGLLQLETVMVTHRPARGVAALSDDLHAHHDYVAELERSGRLLFAGPLLDIDGEVDGTSVWILSVADVRDAERIAREDPYVRAGVRTVDFARWRINMGGLQLNLSCSDQRFSFGGSDAAD